ncbi:MAG: glycosyltransferase family 2 protein [Bacteroidales bacterium]|nr:glycosyltransferase family 2 protein [Candidatus Equimonas enterica]
MTAPIAFSILIPTYNYDCSALVDALQQQCATLSQQTPEFRYEILVADDGSEDVSTLVANRAINQWPGCQFIESVTNVGRSRIRNALLLRAHGAFLLLIDSDAAVCRPDFVARYWQSRHKGSVVVGGLVNPAAPPSPDCLLRYRYEKAAEQRRTLQWRQAHPYAEFTTFNFMLSRKVAAQLRFDERCTEYGYEDTLYGLELEQRGITIAHIDNPLVHLGINSGVAFLANTEAALRTLSQLGALMQQRSPIARLATTLRRCCLTPLVRGGFWLLRPLLRRNLTGRHPSLTLFNCYKVGYYCSLPTDYQ